MPDLFRRALRALYARVEADLAARPGLVCGRSGRCCRFKEAGHELFLTRVEFEELQARGGKRKGGTDRCPWLEDGRCRNREGRALACRTYFCSDEALASEVTERWHREVRRLHDRFGEEYDYRSLADHLR